MNKHLIDFQAASENVFLSAAYLAETIGSSDGRAEAVKEIVGHLLKRGNVDLAAQFADMVEDSFSRDRLLCDVAEKCAALDDDDYARQLAEAVEDEGMQAVAFEKIAAQKAVSGHYEQAAAIASQLDHSSEAWAAIAMKQAEQGNLQDALVNVEKIEYEPTRVLALLEISELLSAETDREKIVEIMESAHQETTAIEFREDRIRTLLSISERFAETGRKDRAIEVLSEARTQVEMLDGAHRQGFFTLISYDFLRAGSIDLADRTLDLVTDKTQIASCLANFSDEFARRGETSEASETLDEAYAVLSSQTDREVRDTTSKLAVLNSIAVRYAEFENYERAREIALENPQDAGRNETLAQIALACFKKGNEAEAVQTLALIADDYTKMLTLLGAFDLLRKNDENDAARKLLSETAEKVVNLQPPASRSTVYNKLSRRFYALSETDSDRRHAVESLKIISRINDESLRVAALATLGDWYDEAKFELTAEEKDILRTMLRKSEW